MRCHMNVCNNRSIKREVKYSDMINTLKGLKVFLSLVLIRFESAFLKFRSNTINIMYSMINFCSHMVKVFRVMQVCKRRNIL